MQRGLIFIMIKIVIIAVIIIIIIIVTTIIFLLVVMIIIYPTISHKLTTRLAPLTSLQPPGLETRRSGGFRGDICNRGWGHDCDLGTS